MEIRSLSDISHHNTIANYSAFRRDRQAVQIKVTESTAFIDPAARKHYSGCAGIPRAPYHFARPISIPQQIAHFIREKDAIGVWERPVMLDCEFLGITGPFIKALKDEYRRQSGDSVLQIYVGLHDFLHTCPPNQWWDSDVFIQVARYRKIGPPSNPTQWRDHLGTDHSGISTYQWDNNTPFYSGSPTSGDISFDRVPVVYPVVIEETPIQERLKELDYLAVTCKKFGQQGFRSAVLFSNGLFVELTGDQLAMDSSQHNLNAFPEQVLQINCDTNAVFESFGAASPSPEVSSE